MPPLSFERPQPDALSEVQKWGKVRRSGVQRGPCGCGAVWGQPITGGGGGEAATEREKESQRSDGLRALRDIQSPERDASECIGVHPFCSEMMSRSPTPTPLSRTPPAIRSSQPRSRPYFYVPYCWCESRRLAAQGF